MIRDRIVLGERSFAEIVVWQLDEPLKGSTHLFKYRLAFVEEGICQMRYDNEAGKGDHKHLGQTETPYLFRDVEALQSDFWRAVAERTS